jgi:Ca2+-binding RTX toxin-like protein
MRSGVSPAMIASTVMRAPTCNDQLLGDGGDDVLEGGLGRDIILGGLGSDVVVLGETADFDLIRDFKLTEGDQVRITIPELLDLTGDVDSELVRVRDQGASLLLEMDSDFDSSNGFQSQTLASLLGAARLDLDQVLGISVA